jgi:hypothetical protein
MKSRRRNPEVLDFGSYWLVDARYNVIVAGDSNVGLDLEGVEAALAE